MLSDIYIPCDGDNFSTVRLEFAGFSATNTALHDSGWQSKCWYNKFTNRYIWRFYHPGLCMTFSLKLDSIDNLENKTFKITSVNYGGRRSPPKLKREIVTELNVDSIPILLETIVELQKPDRKRHIKEMDLPEGEVIELSFLRGDQYAPRS